MERALLWNGNVASADDWHSVLMPIIARYRDLEIRPLFGGDAAFAISELYEALEAESCLYAIRLEGNGVGSPRTARLLRGKVLSDLEPGGNQRIRDAQSVDVELSLGPAHAVQCKTRHLRIPGNLRRMDGVSA